MKPYYKPNSPAQILRWREANPERVKAWYRRAYRRRIQKNVIEFAFFGLLAACGGYVPMSDDEMAVRVAQCRERGLKPYATWILANGRTHVHEIRCEP